LCNAVFLHFDIMLIYETLHLAVQFMYVMCVSFVMQTQMPDPKTYKQHFENKHPKSPMPEELQSVAA